MSKRSAEDDSNGHNNLSIKTSKNPSSQPTNGQETSTTDDMDVGEFEDPYGDDFESDEEIIELDNNQDDDGNGMEEDENMDEEQTNKKIQELELKEQQREQQEIESSIYLPHKSKPLGPDEVLEADPSVYEMLHNVNLPWPCLTVDIIPDNLGNERRSYPATVYLATATQASRAKDNEIIAMKASSLARTLVKDDDDEEDEEEDDDDDMDSDPILDTESIPLKHTTNRIRVNPHAQQTGEYLTATMSESGEAYIFDLSAQYKAFDTPGYIIPKSSKRPIYTIRAHGNVEGYGLDWSPLINTGALLTGDVSGRIHLTTRTSSNWVTDKTPFFASDSSIEDIQWSTGESTVFATAGCDGFVRIWDTRSKKHKPALSVKATESDVNVISWCSKINHLLASGHDDGTWSVWDLRNFTQPNPSPVASYNFHKSPITSISFNPLDESIIAVSSEDNTVTLWDLAVEADDEEISQQRKEIQELHDIPPQLLFVHWQKDVKDVRWHEQIPGCLVSTGGDGLNIWKTISV
ncbi:rrb1 [Candida jiufengensis]|uniref:rrb1 n=1 Tax=Candida jiufengensis TaxID=497108 RepID=UPI0022248118|nr:rrb1 [Candida jiufengensis]KAI5954465.1 rrb1 [Candida jiufengensis]